MALTAEEVAESFRREMGAVLLEITLKRGEGGVKVKKEYSDIYIRLKREALREAVAHLDSLQKYPHLTVISGSDLGNDIELLYHFNLFYGEKHKDFIVTLAVSLPKDDPTIDTISDIVPGAIWQEREKIEMLGVQIRDIPDSRRLLLPPDFPEGVYPWRRDEYGADKFLKKLHEV